MKIERRKIGDFLFALITLLLFIAGNRFGLLMISYSQEGMTPFMIPFEVLFNLIASFSMSSLGFTISLSLIPVFTGILFVAALGITLFWKTTKRKNFREGEEHGSARYADLRLEAEPLRDDKNEDNDMIFSKNVRISMDTRKTWLNDNALVIGGSGSGKTRYHVKPNILQMNCNYVITDPKLSLVPETGKAFIEEGYDFKILNLKDMSKSMRYNPFKYIKKPNDVFKLINNLVANTTDKTKSNGGDEFFVKAEIALMTACTFFIMACAREEEKNINSLMELIDAGEASSEDETKRSLLDVMFEDLEEEVNIGLKNKTASKNDYAFLAIRQYSLYKKGAGDTAKSILISVGVRMGIFNLPEVSDLMKSDELDLESIGKPKKDKNGNLIKTVLFVGISDSDSTFTFIAAILYQQLFDILYDIADNSLGSRLPIHTRFMLDEFANIGKIPDFEIKIATMRSREISVCILLQNLAQLKNMYKDSWETVFGNCDTTFFLGGKEPGTLKYLSELIGNTTIDYLSINENKGGQSNGTYSQSNNLISRALLAPDEIGRLKKDECLIHIRGEHIFRDKKYELLDHPRVNLTTDVPNKKQAEANIFDPTPYIARNGETYKDELPNGDGVIFERGDSLNNCTYVNIKEIQDYITDVESK